METHANAHAGGGFGVPQLLSLLRFWGQSLRETGNMSSLSKKSLARKHGLACVNLIVVLSSLNNASTPRNHHHPELCKGWVLGALPRTSKRVSEHRWCGVGWQHETQQSAAGGRYTRHKHPFPAQTCDKLNSGIVLANQTEESEARELLGKEFRTGSGTPFDLCML